MSSFADIPFHTPIVAECPPPAAVFLAALDVARGALQRRLRVKRLANVASASGVFAFDLLELEGKDIRRQPLLKRKAQLESLLKGYERVRYLGHVGENGERLLEAAERLGLEGIVAKPSDGPYLRGRQSGWLKIKTAAGRAMDDERAK